MRKRLFVIFLDGADYGFARDIYDRGLLPNMARLASRGAFLPLVTSCPAESPVAFAEILTGCNPGKHGIFDFLHRDPANYLPRISTHSGTGADAVNQLARPTLSTPLKRAGLRSALVKMPCTHPPPADADFVLPGLGTPDLAGTWGLASFHSADGDSGRDLFGIETKKYVQTPEGFYRLELEGAGGETACLLVERRDRGFRIGDAEFASGRFSPWIEVAFPSGARGVVAVHADNAQSPSFLATSVWRHPQDAMTPSAMPSEIGQRLMNSTGLYPLAGWPEPNMAYARGRIGFEALREMAERQTAAFEAHLFDALSDPAFDLVMGNCEFFDRIAHAGFGETASAEVASALAGVLVRFDAFIGKVASGFPDAAIWIASDHGFAPWKRRVNLNRWLAENGYLATDLSAPDPDLTSLASGRLLWQGVDWRRTRAYALGLSKIYLNLEGREADGIVPPGRPAELLLKEIIGRLGELRDPADGARVFSRVLDARRLYWGGAMDRSGDLVVCYEPGYRTDWVSSLGGTGTPVVYDNEGGWCADHCGTDPARIPGILIAPSRTALPSLRDIAPSVLRFFDLPSDPDMDGTSFLE